MALSTRELLLILRARDEASRVLRGVSGNMLRFGNIARVADLEAALAAGKHATAMGGLEKAMLATQMRQANLTGATKEHRDAIRGQMLALDQAAIAQKRDNVLMQEELAKINESNRLRALQGQRLLNTGRAMTTFGVVTAAVGAVALVWMGKAAAAAVEYGRQVALTRTQVDEAHVSLKELGAIGIRVAQQIGVPFKQLQPTLYDIFSSMDVSVKQSEVLLKGFAKAAVAGQVDVQVAGRATIAIMNAFHIPIKDVTKVLDFQFQLVRKGVGTYKEFATTIGRSIPSAVRAGQSYQVLGGMLAYLTRNGLSAAMASASAARALDAFSNPKAVIALEHFGIQLKNIHGEFLPLPDIVDQLQKKLASMTGPEKAKALHDLFLGAGGTIQARRFIDMVTKSSQSAAEFRKRVDEMKNSSGQMGLAYGTMADTLAVKTQKMKNQFDTLKVSVGNALIPWIMKLLTWVQKVFDWWNKLSPKTQKLIIIIAALAAIFAVLAGLVITIVGGFLMLAGAAALAGTSLAVVSGVVAVVTGAIAVIVGEIIYFSKNWDQTWTNIKNHPAYAAITALLSPLTLVIFELVSAVRGLSRNWRGAWDYIKNSTTTTINNIVGAWHWLTSNISAGWKATVGFFKSAWAEIKSVVTTGINDVRNIITTILNAVWSFIQDIWHSRIVGIFRDVSTIIAQVVRIGFETVYVFVRDKVLAVWHVIQSVWSFIHPYITSVLNGVKSTVTSVWNAVYGFIRTVLTGIWNTVKSVWNSIYSAIRTTVSNVSSTIRSVWGSISSFISSTWSSIASRASAIWNAVKNAIVTPVRDAYNGVMTWIHNITNAVSGMLTSVKSITGKIASALKAVNPLTKHSPSLVEQTDKGMLMLKRVITYPLREINDVTNKYGTQIRDNMNFGPDGSSSQYPYWSRPSSGGGNTFNAPITINTQEIDPRKHAADLGWEFIKRVGG